jgi:hypothetical protein
LAESGIIIFRIESILTFYFINECFRLPDEEWNIEDQKWVTGRLVKGIMVT